MNSVLTKKQVKKFGPAPCDNGFIIAEVRYDDECGNGHNTFAITAEIYEPYRQPHEPTIKQNGKTYWLNGCGCCHEEVAKAFPELAPLIKWHLMDSTGPMHYTANALYWAGHCGYRDGEKNSPPNIDHLKSTIIYGVLPDDQAFDLEDHIYSDARGFSWNDAKAAELKTWLQGRVERLTAEFQKAIESLGFTF